MHHDEGVSPNLKEIFEKNECKPTETILKHLPLEPKFMVSFFAAVKSSVNEILTVMLKDLNEVWKFFTYFIKMLGYFSDESE